jgi:hypothetical protein
MNLVRRAAAKRWNTEAVLRESEGDAEGAHEARLVGAGYRLLAIKRRQEEKRTAGILHPPPAPKCFKPAIYLAIAFPSLLVLAFGGSLITMLPGFFLSCLLLGLHLGLKTTPRAPT